MRDSRTPTTPTTPTTPARSAFVPDPEMISSYLRRLGLDDQGEPSIEALRSLCRAHVERIPYEVLDIQAGRATSVEPRETVSRVLRGRGGYCVQLNSAFCTLLEALGYTVSWHRAGVQTSAALPPPGAAFAPHLAPVVELEGERWLADVGLGDGLLEPIPLRSGSYTQGLFTFSIAPSQVEPGGWRFEHDPRGSVAGMDVAMPRAGVADFARWHSYLATSAQSRLVRTFLVMRRDERGADILTGCMLRRVEATGKTVRELATSGEWLGALTEVFGLALTDFDDQERTALWLKVRSAHEAWLAAKARKAATAPD
jgi:N-hydroxyarylamine O-acetyltransferase